MMRSGSPKPNSLARGSRATRRLAPMSPTRAARSRQARVGWRSPKLRLVMVWGILMVCVLGLWGNLGWLQMVRSSELQAKAEAQQTLLLNPPPPRRRIVDRLGNVLAVDRPAYTLYAHPKLFKLSSGAIAEKLSPIINRPVSALEQQFRSAESGIEIAYTLSEDVADRVQLLGLDGLELIERQQRFYPQQDLFAEIVGFVNAEQAGQAGLEFSQEEQLQTDAQEVTLRHDGLGAVLPDADPQNVPATNDLELHLTVDSRLQRVVRQALQNTLQTYSAKRGTVLVMDVQDGALLSLVTEPTYDPNEFFEADPTLYRNWAVSDLYEPGSTFKPLNVAIALESGAVQPTQSFQDDGQIYIGEWTIQNSDFEYSGTPGTRSLSDIIKYSSNVGMVRVMQQLSPDVYYEWLEKVGLGETSGVDLPFETPSVLKDQEQFLADPVEVATTAFGQGFALTPLQMLQMQTSLANGGMLLTPHVVDGLYAPQERRPQWQPDRPDPKRLFSLQTTQQVLRMMEGVTDEGGTGTAAQVPGYRVAGKTGTAQKASEFGGYSDARITSFVSFFPADNPRYSILAVIDEPQGDDAYGGTVAAPLVKTVMESMVTLLGIPPSTPQPGIDELLIPPVPDAPEPSDWAEPTPDSYDEPW